MLHPTRHLQNPRPLLRSQTLSLSTHSHWLLPRCESHSCVLSSPDSLLSPLDDSIGFYSRALVMHPYRSAVDGMLLRHHSISYGGICKDDEAKAAPSARGAVFHDDNLRNFSIRLEVIA